MSWSDIRTATKLKLESITDIENVLDYVVWTDDWKFILDTFEKDGRVNTWMVGLANNPLNILHESYRQNDYAVNISAYYSIKTNNESSKVFEDLVMAVRDDFMKSFAYIKTYVLTSIDSAITRPPVNLIIENSVWLQHPVHRMQMQIPVEDKVKADIQCSG